MEDKDSKIVTKGSQPPKTEKPEAQNPPSGKSNVNKKEIETLVMELTPCPDLENKFLHIRVGDRDRPATQKELEEVAGQLEELFEKNNIKCLPFVTHHAVSINIIV